MKLPISVFIIAFNEADRIHLPIKSVIDWVDEVIVIDSGSADGTQATATALGARVLHNDWRGYGMQKRFGEDQCRNAWLLNLDADEEATPELAEEIGLLFSGGGPKHDGYEIGMADYLPGQKSIGRFSYRKWFIRLYNKEKGRFSESPVHDSVIMREGSVARLKAPCFHYSFRNLSHAIDKLNSYSTAQCKDFLDRGKKTSALRLYGEFFVSFLKIYILRRYALRGRQGFTYSVIHAFSRFARLAKWHEAQIRKI